MLKVIKPRLERDRRTPIFNIGAASRLTGLPVWTLRWIEKHSLVSPGRTDGRQRLFSEEDIALLCEIRALIEEGVNLPGVRVILRLRVQYAALPASGENVASMKRSRGGR